MAANWLDISDCDPRRDIEEMIARMLNRDVDTFHAETTGEFLDPQPPKHYYVIKAKIKHVERLILTQAEYETMASLVDHGSATEPGHLFRGPSASLYGVPLEVQPDTPAVMRRVFTNMASNSPQSIGFIFGDKFLVTGSDNYLDFLFSCNYPDPQSFLPQPLRCSMSDETKIADDPVTAADSESPVAAADRANESPATPATSGETSTLSTDDHAAEQVGTAETTEAATDTSEAPTPATTTEAPSGVDTAPEEVGDKNPQEYLAELEATARDVSIDHPDGSGLLLRVRAGLVRIRMMPIVDAGCKVAHSGINTDSKLNLLVGLVGRLVKDNPEKDMHQAVGDHAIADELQRFADMGISESALVSLCSRLVPLVAGL